MSYALKKAVRVGKSDFVKFLLDAGERPSPSEHLLHIAVSRDDVLTASYLVSYITNINEQDDDGNTHYIFANQRKWQNCCCVKIHS